MHAKAGLALLAAHEGDKSCAKEHYAFLLGKRGMTSSVVSVDRLLGLLSQTVGNLDQSAGHFEDAMALCRQARYRPELACTCFDHADLLNERNDQGDRAKAKTLLDESLSISTELGMRPLMERAVAQQERVQAQSGRLPAFLDGPTQREVEVLELIYAGKTDREIGEYFSTASTPLETTLGVSSAKLTLPTGPKPPATLAATD